MRRKGPLLIRGCTIFVSVTPPLTMYSPSVRALSELQSNIHRDRLEEVVVSPFFTFYMATKNEFLLNYISLNVKKIYEYAIFINPTRPAVATRCYELITSGKANLNKEIINNSVLFELIKKTIQNLDNLSLKTRNTFFAILESLSSQSQSLFKIFLSEENLKKILKYIGDSECAIIISNLAKNNKIKPILMKLNVPDLIVAEILKNSETLPCAQQLFIDCYSSLHNNDMYKSLVNDNAIAGIIQNAIDVPSYNSFHFLNQLVKFSLKYGKWSNWRSIFTLIESRLPDIVDVFQKNERFTRASEEIVLLVISIFNETKKMSKEVTDIFYRLYTDFFKYPNHGILHNTFVALLTAMKKNKCLTYELVMSVNFFSTIVEVTDDKYNRHAAYWAQIKRISGIIDPLFRPTEEVPKEKWTQLMLKYREEELIIKKPYGGSTPKSASSINVLVIIILCTALIITLLYLLLK